MLERTHIPNAPWWVIEAVDKKRARLNCMAHLLTRVPYQEVPHQKPVCPRGYTIRLPPPSGPAQKCTCRITYANVAAEHAGHIEAAAAQGGEAKASA